MIKKAEVVIHQRRHKPTVFSLSLKANKNEKTKIFLSFYETYGVTLQKYGDRNKEY